VASSKHRHWSITRPIHIRARISTKTILTIINSVRPFGLPFVTRNGTKRNTKSDAITHIALKSAKGKPDVAKPDVVIASVIKNGIVRIKPIAIATSNRLIIRCELSILTVLAAPFFIVFLKSPYAQPLKPTTFKFLDPR
jgi:hypothetical protein